MYNQNLRYPPLIDHPAPPSALSYDPILYAYIIVILVHPLLHIRLMQRRDNSPSPNSLLPIRLPPRYAFARRPDSLLRRLFATFSIFRSLRFAESRVASFRVKEEKQKRRKETPGEIIVERRGHEANVVFSDRCTSGYLPCETNCFACNLFIGFLVSTLSPRNLSLGLP